MRDVAIREETIRLGQLLKLAGLADSGAEAKALLQDGEVLVGGAVETRRGAQLGEGATVSLGEDVVRVVRSPDIASA